MNANNTDDTDRLAELRDQLQDDLAPVREHRDVFERAAAGDIDDVGDDGAAICRVLLNVLDGTRPDPDDVAVLDAYGDRDDAGASAKLTLRALARGRANPRTWPRERRWVAARQAARRLGITPAAIEASYNTERDE